MATATRTEVPPSTPARPRSRADSPRFAVRYAAYGAVAARCDQIAYMGYDSMMRSEDTYSRFMRWQVRALSEAVSCQLLVGVPTYGEASLPHDPEAAISRSVCPVRR